MLLDHHGAVVALAATLAAASACGDNADHVLRIDGITAGGELGFRFGEPLDLDADGRDDIVAGARRGGPSGHGEAFVWSDDGELRAYWEGADADALFGHVALGVPDLDGDGRGDVVISAPNAIVDGGPRGYVDAYALDGRRIWRATGALYDGFGWHVARALTDVDGDGVEDLLVGAPSNPVTAHAYVISGRSGSVIHTIASGRSNDQFGWYVTSLGDVDGDAMADFVIGAPSATTSGGRRGAVHVISAATGAPLRELTGDIADGHFGEMIASLDDVDGDGIADLAVGAPGETGEVHIVSGATGARIRLLASSEMGELYGRMLASIDDLDGDGRRDLAIGAPWWRNRDGRIEVRSLRTNALLAELHGREQGWLGWHITAAPGALLASQLHADGDTGALELHVLR